MEDAQTIPKNGWNSYGDYKYVLASDVFEKVSKLLVKHKVSFVVSDEVVTREKDGKNYHIVLKCKARFSNIDTPSDHIVSEFSTIATDTLDKDIFKAKTSGIKHLFQSMFLITAEDFDRNGIISGIKNKLFALTDGFEDKDSLADVYSKIGIRDFNQILDLDISNLKTILERLSRY